MKTLPKSSRELRRLALFRQRFLRHARPTVDVWRPKRKTKNIDVLTPACQLGRLTGDLRPALQLNEPSTVARQICFNSYCTRALTSSRPIRLGHPCRVLWRAARVRTASCCCIEEPMPMDGTIAVGQLFGMQASRKIRAHHAAAGTRSRCERAGRGRPDRPIARRRSLLDVGCSSAPRWWSRPQHFRQTRKNSAGTAARLLGTPNAPRYAE